ncbi:hypothetical protein [Candidatus Methylobacter oryzae]|uniref:Uncharacterized protein n=1 Tax=Candidatus Methylobacter oryzae TaxID=2497749 RepID=A0ABY3C5W9_9GAMM|nr:hypothetical protein [Candidatus Methylobacter oryzae]TRW90635.1 hypothetical protein EKO24_018620 [Candidatus Methylobacter oryzae]
MAVRSVAIGREPMRPTATDGGRDGSRQFSALPPAIAVRSAGAAGSGSSKNLEGLAVIFPTTYKYASASSGSIFDC